MKKLPHSITILDTATNITLMCSIHKKPSNVHNFLHQYLNANVNFNKVQLSLVTVCILELAALYANKHKLASQATEVKSE